MDLEDQLKANQKLVMECIEKIDSLYERLTLDANTKFQFLAENQGWYSRSIRIYLTELKRAIFPEKETVRFKPLESL